MTKPGPRPENKKTLRLRGSWRGKLPEPPKLPAKRPRCPEWLSETAKTEWRRISPVLHRYKLLTDMSLQFWAGYCESYARFREADKALDDLKRQPDVTPMMVRRLAATRNDFLRMMMRALRESGTAPYLTPGAEVEKPKKKDEVDKSRFFKDPPQNAG